MVRCGITLSRHCATTQAQFRVSLTCDIQFDDSRRESQRSMDDEESLQAINKRGFRTSTTIAPGQGEEINDRTQTFHKLCKRFQENMSPVNWFMRSPPLRIVYLNFKPPSFCLHQKISHELGQLFIDCHGVIILKEPFEKYIKN